MVNKSLIIDSMIITVTLTIRLFTKTCAKTLLLLVTDNIIDGVFKDLNILYLVPRKHVFKSFRNSEADVSEFLGNIQEMFSRYTNQNIDVAMTSTRS